MSRLSAFRTEMLSLDGRIQRALQEPPAECIASPAATPARPAPAWRQWALAASMLLATALVVGSWCCGPSDTLARDLVETRQG